MKRAFIFPGQGSQFVGMGKDLNNNFKTAKLIFQEVDDAVGYHLSHIMFDGLMEELTLTKNTQPALMAVSYAIIAVLQKEFNFSIRDFSTHVAGHSLGEYSALAAANSLSLTDTAKLLKIRGESMQEAASSGIGAMVALLGCDLDEASNIAQKAAQEEICQIANDNAVGQIVLSGHATAIDRAIMVASEMSKKAIKLPVSGPFHSELMTPAKKIMHEALSKVNIKQPEVTLISNVTALPTNNPEEIKYLLEEQITSKVRWRETILYLKDQEVTEIVEIGAGKVLSGLNKRIDPSLNSVSIQSAQDIENFVEKCFADN